MPKFVSGDLFYCASFEFLSDFFLLSYGMIEQEQKKDSDKKSAGADSTCTWRGVKRGYLGPA